MMKYIGVKEVNAKRITKGEFEFLMWGKIQFEDGMAEDGYLVEYLDGGKPNHKDYKGYISWSPKDVFERAYKLASGMDFGMALNALKTGLCVGRSGWIGKGMWIALIHPEQPEDPSIKGPQWAFEYRLSGSTKPHMKIAPLPWIGLRTADAQFVPWLASQTDMLATDWQVVE